MDKRRKLPRTESDILFRREFMMSLPTAPADLSVLVKTLRKISLLTQEEFSCHVGIGINVLKAIESGRGNPTIETLNKIGKPFGLGVSLARRKPPEDGNEK